MTIRGKPHDIWESGCYFHKQRKGCPTVTTDVDLSIVDVGDLIEAGECLFEVTQIGKKCHHGCAIFQRVGKCEMRTHGVFTRVLRGGRLRVGDPLRIIKKNRVKDGAC